MIYIDHHGPTEHSFPEQARLRRTGVLASFMLILVFLLGVALPVFAEGPTVGFSNLNVTDNKLTLFTTGISQNEVTITPADFGVRLSFTRELDLQALSAKRINLNLQYFSNLVFERNHIDVFLTHSYKNVNINVVDNKIEVLVSAEDFSGMGRVIDYKLTDGMQVFPVYTRLGFPTIVKFTENIQRVILGEQGFFNIPQEVIRDGRNQYIQITPRIAGARSGLIVITDNGVYRFALLESEYHSPYYQVNVPDPSSVQTGSPFFANTTYVLQVASGSVTEPNARRMVYETPRPFLSRPAEFEAFVVAETWFRDYYVVTIQMRNLTRNFLEVNKDYFMVKDAIGVAVQADVKTNQRDLIRPGSLALIHIIFMNNVNSPQDGSINQILSPGPGMPAGMTGGNNGR